MDPLYDEEYDASGAHSLLTQDCDEESMDIYSGLGDTPTHATEVPSMLFSPRLKASMDLYEEILTEEVRSKDSSFEELKSRFLAAQTQIEELRGRLTTTETQNTGLSTENLRLKKNISALLKTARQEVLRKDEEIKRLNQSAGMKTYNPRGNGHWRTFPNPNHANTPPPVPAQPPPRPGPGHAPSPIGPPTSRTAAAPAATPTPYPPPPPQHRPCRTPSAGSSSTPAPPAPPTTPLIPPSHALPPPPARRTSLTRSSAAPTAPPHPPTPHPRASRSSACRPPAPPTETAPPSLPRPQQSKTPSSLSATCTPPPPPTNPAPPKRRPSRTSSSTSSLSCRPPAPPTESPLPAPSQSGLVKRSLRISSSSTPPVDPPPPPPPSLPLPKPIRTSSRISTSKEPPPPPPPTLDPPPPPPPTLDPPPPPPPTLDPPPPPPPTLDPPPPPLPTLEPPPPPPPTLDPPPPTLDPPPPPPPTLDPPLPTLESPPPPPPTLEPPPPPPTLEPPPPPPTLDPPPPTLEPPTPPPTLDPPPPPPPTLDPPLPTADSTPPPPPTADPPPPPVLHPRAPSPLREDVRPESFPPPPPPEEVSDRAARRPDTTCQEAGRSKRSPAHGRPAPSSSLDLEATVEPPPSSQSSSEVPAELCEQDTPRPPKHQEQEPRSQTRSRPTEKRLKSGPEPGKDCEAEPRNRSRRAEKESRTKHRGHRLPKSGRSQEADEEHHRSEGGESPGSGGADRRPDKAESSHNGAELRASRSRDSSAREPRKEKQHGDRAGEKRASGGRRDRRTAAPQQRAADGAGETSRRKGDRADPPSSSGDARRRAARRREDEGGRRERRGEKHKDSDRNRRKDEGGRRKAELRGGGGGEKSAKDLERASEEEEGGGGGGGGGGGVPAGTQCPTEDSPNRKLCFMETLNLTLSPVKKPLSQQGQADGEEEEEEEEEEGEILSREDEGQPNLEDFLVLDEIESSMTEMEIDDDDDKRKPTPSSAVQTSTRGNWAAENGKEDQSLRATETGVVAAVSGRPEVPPVPSPSAGVLPEAEEGSEAGGPPLTRPVAAAKESIVVSKRPAENRPCPSPNGPVVVEMSETLNLGKVELVRVSEDGKGRPGNLSEVIEPAEPTVLHSEPDLQESPSTAPVDCKKLSGPCPLPGAEEVKETVLLSPLTSPVAEKVKETVLLSPLTSPVAEKVTETVLLSPLTSPVAEKVKEAVSFLSPLTSPVAEKVKEAVLLSPLTSPGAEKVREAVLLSPLTSPVAEEVQEAVLLSPLTSPVAEKVKEAVSFLSPLTSPVAGEVKEAVSFLSPLTSPVAEEVKEAVSVSRPISSSVVDVVKEAVSLPCPIPRPVCGEVNQSRGRLSPTTGPVSEGVHQTTAAPRPLKEPVPGAEVGRAPSPCPITRLLAGAAQGKVRPEGLSSPPNARPPPPRAPASPPGGGEGERRGGSPKGSDAVSSTITLEALPPGDISLPEAIYALTHAADAADSDDDDDRSADGGDGGGVSPGSTPGCVGVSKVSSTTEDLALPGRRESAQERTPLKGYGFCVRRGGGAGGGAEPSSSRPPPLYDEDSMMLTLRNLRSIPDVISPLRSPAPPARRLPGPPGPRSGTKPPHVKSLQRDFCGSGIFHNLKPNPKKETPPHKALHPGEATSLRPPPGRSEGPSPPPSDLEEGEILSDSNDAPAADTPPPPGPKPAGPADGNKTPKPSPRPPPRAAKRRLLLKGVGGAPPPSTPSPSSGKSRFKAVCPAVAEQAALRSAAEVMDTLKTVRFQIRKKYMKLHKVFPKKSFYAMMDHFRQSFAEYVESAAFGAISGQAGALKARLRKLVASVFGKVMNNGIVNRIFDQQAANLKSRLWDFVEVQLDYLFLDIEKALDTFCTPAAETPPPPPPAAAESPPAVHPKNGKIPKKSPPVLHASPPKKKKSGSPKPKRPQRRIKPGPGAAPARTGLGRGKDIRIICTERRNADTALPPRGAPPLSPDRGQRGGGSLLLSHGGAPDYDILTEQQASSLTFNLVRDTQMGEIFKCLMQGSDLLDGGGGGGGAGGGGGDHTSWSLSTPRKEGAPGDSLLGLLPSPGKFLSPSKFASSPGKFATPTKFGTSGAWAGLLSPGRLCSPQPKLLRTPLHPSVFDESCLLELPSASGAAAAGQQRSYALLAEDLAVSLTIPSPLKSDGHLSFLQQPARTLDMMSTPESVISAHFGEDALLDGEDAWEQQDLHLALDTDHSDSSRCSSGASTPAWAGAAGGAGASPASMLFQYKPHLPMQAEVMERSNDHFVIKIRQFAAADVTLTTDDEATPTSDEATPTSDDSLSRTLTEEAEPSAPTRAEPVPRALFLEKSFAKSPRLLPKRQKAPPPEETAPADPGTPQKEAEPGAEAPPSRPPDSSASSADEMEESTASEGRLAIVEDGSSGSTPARGARGAAGRKRRSHQQQHKSSAKRARKEEEGRGRGRRSKPGAAAAVAAATPRVRGAKRSGGAGSPPKTPPSGLSAKNLVKKKGEVVVAWTREEDRSILLDLKTKGPSRETFSVLSEKLHKTSAQIAERFSQLMKLFKKQEKRTSP